MNTEIIYKHSRLIPIHTVDFADLYKTSNDIDYEHANIPRAFCTAQHKQKCTHAYASGCVSNLVFPIWTLNDTYVVHTGDNELCRKEWRPEPKPDYLKELVHEVRYNANLPEMLPTAIKEVERKFNKKRKKEVEREFNKKRKV